ncbi:SLC13 family permease [Rodentibacter pneumotropicus]|uniref:SLC13 family permease n=1 Tax=Rodentibacter pneumotropicus TaxID=758 RepID=UPI000985D9A1|nr:DASS family sodium-coupled anion symporter [Rodentibacter pneumotropicus]OOF61374.1 transporter [Rodentibacter pneumotropicus]THA18682.1 DASS family sodium-coupled anion symporter [Rodentibacter pneumotropicus]
MQKNTTYLSKYKSLIILVLDFILMLVLIKHLPFSPQENRGLALLIFVGILWLTEAFNITVTSLMVPIVAIGLGLINTQKALAPFSTPIIYMFFGGFVVAAVLQIQNLDKIIANYIIRLAKGNLKLSVAYLFGVTIFLSMWINNTAVAAMMLPLTVGMLKGINAQKNYRLYCFVLLGMAFSANIGGIGTLVGSAPNAILASQIQVTFTEWLAYGFPVMLLLIPSMIFALWVILRPDFSTEFSPSIEKVELNQKNILTLGIFIFMTLLLLFGSIINPWISQVLELPKKIENFDTVIALLVVILICVSKVASWKEIQERVEWGVLLLFGGGLTLSIVMKDSGASKIMADTIVQFVQEKPLWVLCFAIASFIIFLTEFTSNTASAALIMPIIISVAQSMGLPPIALAAIIACGASCAFMLPIATPPNAIVFSTGHVKQADMAKVGFILNLFCISVIGGFAYFMWI